MNDLPGRIHDAINGLDDWRRRLFGPIEDVDGETIGGVKLVRGPDGRLYGVVDAPKKENENGK
jgi:hypothetical protein